MTASGDGAAPGRESTPSRGASPAGRPLQIHYRRPPDREEIYEQRLIVDRPEVQISLQSDTPLSAPMEIEGRRILEPGSPVVWFTFPGRWHDIGRFHLADGTFTGYYANVLTPVQLHHRRAGGVEPLVWHTTDLFLDIWLGRDGGVRVLDREELAEAEARGWVDAPTAARARGEARALVQAAAAGRWPPAVVDIWTLGRGGPQSSSSSTTQAPARRSTSR